MCVCVCVCVCMYVCVCRYLCVFVYVYKYEIKKNRETRRLYKPRQRCESLEVRQPACLRWGARGMYTTLLENDIF